MLFQHFSSCSISSIGSVLQAKAPSCFTSKSSVHACIFMLVYIHIYQICSLHRCRFGIRLCVYLHSVSYLCVTLFCQIRMCLGLYRVINQSRQSQNKGFYQIYCVFIITISHWHIIAWIWLPCYYPSDNQLNKDLLNLTCLWCLENGIICYFMKPSETVTNLYIMKKNRLKSYLQPSYQVTIDW